MFGLPNYTQTQTISIIRNKKRRTYIIRLIKIGEDKGKSIIIDHIKQSLFHDFVTVGRVHQ